MYKKYFSEFYVSNEELQAKIDEALQSLTVWWPEEFSEDLAVEFSLASDTESRIRVLTERVGVLRNLEPDLERIPEDYALRVCAIVLSSAIDVKMIEHLSLKLIHQNFSTMLLGFRYLYACDLLETVLQESLRYDRDKLSDDLFNPWGNDEQGRRLLCALVAEEEIARVADDPRTSDLFFDTISELENSVEKYITEALPDVISESYFRVFIEAVLANSPILEKTFGETLDPADAKKTIEQIRRVGSNRMSARLGIKRGGARPRKGFTWDDERKVILYRTVSDLPRINSVPLWDYAYKMLCESDFSYRIVEYLRTDTPLKDVSDSLFREAVRTWKKYGGVFSKPKPPEKPFAFAVRHAVEILGFPPAKYSTLRRYYGDGKRLYVSND